MENVIAEEAFEILSERNVSNDNGLLYCPNFNIPFMFDKCKSGRFTASVAKTENDSKYYNIKNKKIRVIKYKFIEGMPMFTGLIGVGSKDVLLIKEWEFV